MVLDNFKTTVTKGEAINAADILKEAQNLAAKKASGAMGAITSIPRALQHINWLEFILALGTIFIIYGFKRITTAIPSTLLLLLLCLELPLHLT